MHSFSSAFRYSSALLLVFLLPHFLSGCAFLLQPRTPITVFTPNLTAPVGGTIRLPVAVNVFRPTTDSMRDSNRILVREHGTQLSAWPQVAWPGQVPDMVQQALIDGLTDQGLFGGGVGRPGEARAEVQLLGHIRSFEAVVLANNQLQVALDLQLRLLRARDTRELATQRFQVHIPIAERDIRFVIPAFSTGLTQLIAEIGVWLEQPSDWHDGPPGT